MTNIMTPSVNPITAGQIGKFQELLGARLRKSGLQNKSVQQVLAAQGDAIADEMVAAIRKRVEAMSSIIVRRVKVDRTRTPQAMLYATGRNKYVTDSVVKAMPKGNGDEVEVHFFKLDRYVSDADLDKEYELRGLIPADPYSQGAVNEADPAFADDHPNGTHWKDAQGKWCCATFDRWDVERHVFVSRRDYVWDGHWWFAGFRKK
ncbi:MAG TPA: hypothetical protein VIJ88_02810 [Candidatus Paceibacterota bacterium]